MLPKGVQGHPTQPRACRAGFGGGHREVPQQPGLCKARAELRAKLGWQIQINLLVPIVSWPVFF